MRRRRRQRRRRPKLARKSSIYLCCGRFGMQHQLHRTMAYARVSGVFRLHFYVYYRLDLCVYVFLLFTA